MFRVVSSVLYCCLYICIVVGLVSVIGCFRYLLGMFSQCQGCLNFVVILNILVQCWVWVGGGQVKLICMFCNGLLIRKQVMEYSVVIRFLVVNIEVVFSGIDFIVCNLVWLLLSISFSLQVRLSIWQYLRVNWMVLFRLVLDSIVQLRMLWVEMFRCWLSISFSVGLLYRVWVLQVSWLKLRKDRWLFGLFSILGCICVVLNSVWWDMLYFVIRLRSVLVQVIGISLVVKLSGCFMVVYCFDCWLDMIGKLVEDNFVRLFFVSDS